MTPKRFVFFVSLSPGEGNRFKAGKKKMGAPNGRYVEGLKDGRFLPNTIAEQLLERTFDGRGSDAHVIIEVKGLHRVGVEISLGRKQFQIFDETRQTRHRLGHFPLLQRGHGETYRKIELENASKSRGWRGGEKGGGGGGGT